MRVGSEQFHEFSPLNLTGMYYQCLPISLGKKETYIPCKITYIFVRK